MTLHHLFRVTLKLTLEFLFQKNYGDAVRLNSTKKVTWNLDTKEDCRVAWKELTYGLEGKEGIEWEED